MGRIQSFIYRLLAVLILFFGAVGSAAAGTITNIALVSYNTQSALITSQTNSVNVIVTYPSPVITFYTDATFATTAYVGFPNSPLYIQVEASGCNVSGTAKDTLTLTLTSKLTGDAETFTATETGNNTAKFQILPNVPTQDGSTAPAVPGNGKLEVMQNDTVTAAVSGCGSTTTSQATILIDPYGVVFDSKTNAPVSGAMVMLIDVTGNGNGNDPGGLAKVYASMDMSTTSAATVTTSADGRFSFPLVKSSTYKIQLTPSNGYTFPSKTAVGALPAGRTINDAGSYGGNFTVSTASGAVRLDVPLDAGALAGLFIEKTASATSVELADFVDYTLKVKNQTGRNLAGISVSDSLPQGFKYIAGTTRLNGSPASDPEGGAGPGLVFKPGDLADGATITIAYRLLIGVGARLGENANSAQAKADSTTVSNVAQAIVKVRGGVFAPEGYILGKVFVDCNQNGIQDAAEPGIPGVRIYLEDGTFVITDGTGKYSFYGISPRTHVLKIDSTTMPACSRLMTISNRFAGDPNSRFVDLKNSELHKADFAEGSCTEDILKEVAARKAKEDAFIAESDSAASAKLALSGESGATADPKSLPASGLVGAGTRLPSFPQTQTKKSAPGPDNSADHLIDTQVITFPDEAMMQTMDNDLGFIGLKDGDALPGRQVNIVVKGAAGSTFAVTVNDREVPRSRVGKKALLEARQLQVWEYIGIDMPSGANRISVSQSDPYGNIRGALGISVQAPEDLSEIVFITPGADAVADGRTPVTLKVQLKDRHGLSIVARTPLTLETSAGQWQEKDLNELEPGVQVFVEGGAAEYKLIPPLDPGEAVIRVSSGGIKKEKTISFVPELRPMIAVGLVEGALNMQKLDAKNLLAARPEDGFDQELRSYTSSNGDIFGGGRTAFYLKGKVSGDYLLTLAYDSDKSTQEQLFRDIQPDEFYPVYGDSSIRGYDAQSTGKLYVRVDKGRSFVLYGDYTTGGATEVRSLGAYNRSLNGIKGHYEQKRASINVFASQQSTKQVIEEQSAMGISGPYYINNLTIISNSEQIEIVTRDRNQSSIVLKTETMTRFSDYEIDYLTGSILFKAPISSMDENLNPRYIRVTYEVDQGGEEFWVAGVDGQVKVTDRFEVGGSYVQDNNPEDKYSLSSVNAAYRLADKTVLIAERADTERDEQGKDHTRGAGQRIELKHEGKELQARVYAADTDINFDNSAAAISKGSDEAGAKITYRLNPETMLRGEALHSRDKINGGSLDGVLMGVERNLTQYARVEAGVRYARETASTTDGSSETGASTEFTSGRVKLGTQLPSLPKLGVFGEVEQSFDSSAKRVAIGGDYQFMNQGRFYAKHEFINSLGGEFSLNSSSQRNTTLVGIQTDYMKDGQVFSEYRVKDSSDGRDAEASVGLRNQWRVAEGVRLNASFERVKNLGQTTSDNEYTSVTGAVEYLAKPRWKSTARLEVRDSDTSRTYLNTLGAAYRVNDGLTLLARNVLSATDSKTDTGDKLEWRVQAGFAYRPSSTNVWNALTKIEYRYQTEDDGSDTYQKRDVEIFSTHVNYQPTKPLTLTGHYAGKLATEVSSGVQSHTSAHLVSGRFLYDIAERWDAGFLLSTLFSDSLHSRQYGAGVEAGYLVKANIWFSVGYNIFGFEDRDLTSGQYTSRGFFLRLRMKFDETLFSGNDSAVNRTLASDIQGCGDCK